MVAAERVLRKLILYDNALHKAIASLSLPGGQDKNISSIFPHFPEGSLIFPQNFFIFFLILVFRVGGSPTREGPGYATGTTLQSAGLFWPNLVATRAPVAPVYSLVT